MKQLLSTLVVTSVLVLGGAASASAKDKVISQAEFEARVHKAECLAERVKRIHTYQQKLNKLKFGHDGWKPRGPSVAAPELDANAAGSAMALLIGGALVLADRRRRAVA